ncbi:MAG: VTT domain-containing protein [Candidatus Solibacter usitatus]|nr:VTT domain-containing protein [Candidatus Solibacter usitatus]
MKQFVTLLTSWGPAGVFLLAVLDSAGIPLPAAVDALVVATAAVHPASAYLSAAMAVAGSLVGCMCLFYVGRKGGQAYLDRVTQSGRNAKLRAWFQTYGLISVFIPALLPIPLPVKIFVLSSGALGVRPLTFLFVILAARIPRYFGLAWLGAQLGENTMGWLKSHIPHLFGVALGLLIVLSLLVWMYQRQPARR